MKRIYSSNVAGCYADGSYGHEHVRSVLARILRQDFPNNARAEAIAQDIESGPYSDASEEDAAIDFLNQHSESDVVWEFVDGDLMLLKVEESGNE